jgi:hypothetical protein
LLKQDQSTFDIPFAIGSVIVTIWLLATGMRLWREQSPTQIDLANQPKSSTSRTGVKA